MAIDLLNLEPNVISRDLREKIVFLYGEPKIGKTTLASKFPKSLLLAYEKGYNALPNVMAQPINKWSDMKAIMKQLENPEVQEKFETIVIDTIDLMAFMVEEMVKTSNRVTDLSDIKWGKGYTKLKDEIRETLRKIPNLGYGLVMISHDKDKVVEKIDGVEITKIVPTLSNSIKEIATGMADIYTYMRGVTDKETGEHKVYLYFRGNDYFEAGSRFKYIENFVEATYDNLVNAIGDAIDKEAELDSSSVTEEVKENLYKETEIDFEEKKSEMRKYINEILKHKACEDETVKNSYMEQITKIGQEYLSDQKMNDITEDQVDLLVMIVSDLEDLLAGMK